MTDAIEIQRPIVQVRQCWADPWKTMENLLPVGCQCTASPTVPTAKFLWRVGTIGHEGHAFDTYGPTDPSLLNWYIRIAAVIERVVVLKEDLGEPSTVWAGIVTVDEAQPGKSDRAVPTGKQMLTARGLEWRLHQAAVDGSWALVADEPQHIDTVLPFNIKTRAGNSVVGNRSTAKYPRGGIPADGPRAYVFADEGEIWTARDIAEYLLVWFGPKCPYITLAGATGNLDLVKRIYPGPASVGAGLNMVMDRRRGHVWRMVEDGEDLSVTVEPIFTGDIAAGTVRLTGNADTIQIDTEAAEVADFKVRDNLDQRFDRIVVRGGPVIVCGTLSFIDETLEKSWTNARETVYKAASDENRRNDERLRNVYTAYRVPAAWPSVMGGAAGTYTLKNASPTVKADGTLDFETGTNIWRLGKQLLRQLPLRVGYDYSKEVPEVLDADAPDEFMMATCYIKYDTDKYAPVDRLDQCFEGAPAMRVRILDGELGVQVGCHINHWLANNHWGGAGESAYSPVFDYEDMVATIALATDQRLAVTVSLGGVDPDFARTKTIEVDGAEAWALLARTVIGVSGGTIQRSPDNVVILRNDREALSAVAAAAKAWYCQDRGAAMVTFRELHYSIQPGDFLTELEGGLGNIPVNTMVSRVSYDFDKGTTVVETDHSELDFIGLVGAGPAGSAALRVPALGAPAVRDKRVGVGVREPAPALAAAGLADGTGYAQVVYWDPDAGEYKLSAVPADPVNKNYEYVWDKATKKVKAVEIGPFVCDPP